MKCPGHFGHIELAYPVFHYQYINTIQKLLKCVCLNCSKLLINKNTVLIKNLLKTDNKNRFNEIYNLSQKISRCGQETIDGCGSIQPKKFKLEGIDGIYAIWNNLDVEDSIKTQLLRVEIIKEIFEKLTNEDCNVLGFSNDYCRPEWLICSVLPVPPPSVRPSVKQEDSQRMDDDLTHKLVILLNVIIL